MLIAFDSKTGNVKRFITKLNMDAIQITAETKINQPFILVTYTTGFGQAPVTTMEFLRRNAHFLRGIASSGNMNWGTRYGRAADIISHMYAVPILLKFELSGTSRDVEQFLKEVGRIDNANTEVDSA